MLWVVASLTIDPLAGITPPIWLKNDLDRCGSDGPTLAEEGCT